MAGRRRPSPRVDDPREEERTVAFVPPFGGISWRHPQGGGGRAPPEPGSPGRRRASPYRFGGASGRRREAAA